MENLLPQNIVFYHQFGGEVVGRAFKQVVELFGIGCECRQIHSNLFNEVKNQSQNNSKIDHTIVKKTKEEHNRTDVFLFCHKEPYPAQWGSMIELLLNYKKTEISQNRMLRVFGATTGSGDICGCLGIKPSRSINALKFLHTDRNDYGIDDINLTNNILTMLGALVEHSRDIILQALYLSIIRGHLKTASSEDSDLEVKNLLSPLQSIYEHELLEKLEKGISYPTLTFESKDFDQVWNLSWNIFKATRETKEEDPLESDEETKQTICPLNVLILDDFAFRHYETTHKLHNITPIEDFEEIRSYLIENGHNSKLLYDYDVIFLDSNFGDAKYGWREFAVQLRNKYPNAFIYLVSSLSDSKVEREFEVHRKLPGSITDQIDTILELEDLINGDPRVLFIPKPPNPEDVAGKVNDIIERHWEEAKAKERLTSILLNTANDAYNDLMGMKIGELLVKRPSAKKPVDAPHEYDMVVERAIQTGFLSLVHEYALVLATEEEGVQNVLFRKIKEPRFYLISDPLDGSSKFEDFLKKLLKQNVSKDKKFADVINEYGNERIQKDWECGPIEISAPTIAISLAERDRVFASVLVNVFTGRMVYSTPEGNKYCKLLNDDGSVGRHDKSIPNTLNFRDSDNLSKARHCLAQLKAVKLMDDGSATVSYQHFEQSTSPYFRNSGIEVDESVLLRYVRCDFTPGPSRVLFMTKIFEDEYLGSSAKAEFKSTTNLDELVKAIRGETVTCALEENYRIIFSNGEPVTEWIHWFAFLHNDRYANWVRAYRLNKPNRIRWKNDSKSYMAPPEVSAIFKNGHLDFKTLFSSYHDKMHRYTDTIIMCDRDLGEKLSTYVFVDHFSKAVLKQMEDTIISILEQIDNKKGFSFNDFKICCDRVNVKIKEISNKSYPEHKIITEDEEELKKLAELLDKFNRSFIQTFEAFSSWELADAANKQAEEKQVMKNVSDDLMEKYISLRRLAKIYLRRVFIPIHPVYHQEC